MKLKYYMRGLGIGIILTTLLLTLGNPKEKLSDQEIKSRAEKLGMVMKEENNANLEQVLADIKPTALPDGASVTPSPKGSPAPTAKPTVQPTKEPTAAPTPEPTAVPTKEPVQPTIEPTPVIVQPDSSKTDDGQSNSSDITFTVKSGMSSGQVAKMLVQAGLVDDAEDFNDYIEKAGKASIIRVGTYTLPKDSTYKEIITAITTK